MIRTKRGRNEFHAENPDHQDERKKDPGMTVYGCSQKRIHQVNQQKTAQELLAYFVKIGTYAVNISVQPEKGQNDRPGRRSPEALRG